MAFTKTITAPGDTADKIDYQKMEKITRTIYMTLWEIANRPVRLKVDKPLPAQISGVRIKTGSSFSN